MIEKIDIFNRLVPLFFEDIKVFEISTNIEKIDKGYKVKRQIKNVSNRTLKLKGLKATLSGITFNENPIDDYFYCNENARLFFNLTIPLDYNRYDDNAKENAQFNLSVDRSWCDPGVQAGRICSSPYQPFPAILLSNYQSNDGIVIGSLSQDVFYHSYEVGHKDGYAFIEIYSDFKSVKYREVKPGETLVDEIYIGETKKADDINKIFEDYTSVLRQILSDNAGARKVNRHTLIWDSWNDGVYRDVSEEMLICEAKAVKKYFPNVEWFQLDDGYSAYCEENVDLDAHGIGVVYEGEEGVDYKKFPNGLKGYTDKIKELGLKPALWIGAFCPVKTKIYQERPDWFIDYSYRIDWTQPLDVSKKEVQEYMAFAVETLINKYGFLGLKHDFWSYAFEDRHDLLVNKDKSGYEYRTWWQKTLREIVGDGYIETGCDISFGNPFLGKYFNNYRFGDDIGAGKWQGVKASVFFSVAVLSTHTGDLFIPNSDSIGLLPGLNDTDFMFAVNWQIITRSLVEISGRYSLVNDNNSRLKVLQRATKYLNNGENVYFAKYDYRQKGLKIPEIMYINTAFDADDDGYVTVALFNADENSKTIKFKFNDIGLSEKTREVEFVWQNRTEKVSKLSFDLSMHESMLLKIKK